MRKGGEWEGEYSYREEQLESRPSKKIRGGERRRKPTTIFEGLFSFYIRSN